jgi:prolyl-tRNA editing enzyme YbaK/EbsC (Cys-tRNA(Pro) deacylase)
MVGVIGKLETVPAATRPDLMAIAVYDALANWTGATSVNDIKVAAIDPDLADTAAFCTAYDVGLEISANCVVVAGKREGVQRFAACMVLATTRADVNNVVRRLLDVRKLSFAPMDTAVSETSMEYGGITPIGLPSAWPIYVDTAVAATPLVVIGSGVRRSKIVLPGATLAEMPNAQVIDGLANPI